MADSSEELYKKAYSLHYNDARHEEAREIYQQIIEEFPLSKEARYARTQAENIDGIAGDEKQQLRDMRHAIARRAAFEEEAAARREKFEAHRARVMTVNPSRPYQVVAPVFAIGQATSGVVSMIMSGLFGAARFSKLSGFKGDPTVAFQYAVESLIEQCDAVEADAAVGCHFEHRVALDAVNNQAFEVMAYGTAVRWIDDGNAD